MARCGLCRFGGVYSRAGCSGHHCRSKGLCLRSPARRLPRPLTSATVGVFASTGLAIIKSRLCRLAAAKVGVPVGHRTGYNYFLACDTAERIIFAVVTGSGSGKLCRHSRGNNNDQENAGYVRENGQRRTGVAREGFLDRRSKRCFWLLLSPQTKVARAGARNSPLRRGRGLYAAARRHLIRPLRGHLPLKGKA